MSVRHTWKETKEIKVIFVSEEENDHKVAK